MPERQRQPEAKEVSHRPMHAEGRVLHRGVPQPDCQVLLVDEPARAVSAVTDTDADGRWALDSDGALVFARCRGEALGVVAAPAGSVDLIHGPVTVTIRLEARPTEVLDR